MFKNFSNSYNFTSLSQFPTEMDAEGSSKMATLTKDQFRGLLQNGRLTRVCKNECLHMNWVPILLQTDDDIEFAVRKNAVVSI